MSWIWIILKIRKLNLCTRWIIWDRKANKTKPWSSTKNKENRGGKKANYIHSWKIYHVDFPASAAFSSSCIFLKDGGGLGIMLLFHCRSSFLDNLLLIPSSISLSLFTISMCTTYFKQEENDQQIEKDWNS